MKTKIQNSNVQQKNWHAIYVKSRSEKKVMQTLIQKGIEAYVPLSKTMRQWSDRKKLVEFPLINGYVFVHIQPIENEKTLHTNGVVNFVRLNGKIALIRESEIERLKQLIELGYQLESDSDNSTFEIGEKVKITSGPLKNLEGQILNKSDEKIFLLELETIGKSIKVKLPKDILIASTT